MTSKNPPARKGTPLKILIKGDRRRMSDGKNAWRKMTEGQRVEFLYWIEASHEVHPIPQGWTVEPTGQTTAQRNELAALLIEATA